MPEEMAYPRSYTAGFSDDIMRASVSDELHLRMHKSFLFLPIIDFKVDSKRCCCQTLVKVHVQ